MSSCCVQGFEWDGTPSGKEITLAGNKTYVTGPDGSDAAVMIVHDILGWTFPNVRLLADHYAREINATVYVPDFFGGEVISPDTLHDEAKRNKLDIPAFLGRNSKDIRGPEVFACARALRTENGHKRVGAVGFCYGGWAVFRLGAKVESSAGSIPVDCIATAHPSLLEKNEIEKVGVPVQILAPEHDPMFSPEMKEFSNTTIPTLGVPYDYQFFPSLEHGFGTRGDPNKKGDREGMARAKNAVVHWMRQWLHSH